MTEDRTIEASDISLLRELMTRTAQLRQALIQAQSEYAQYEQMRVQADRRAYEMTGAVNAQYQALEIVTRQLKAKYQIPDGWDIDLDHGTFHPKEGTVPTPKLATPAPEPAQKEPENRVVEIPHGAPTPDEKT